jgi:hypothetical protein
MNRVRNLQRRLNRSVQGDVNYTTSQLIKRWKEAETALAVVEKGRPFPMCRLGAMREQAAVNIMDREREKRWESYEAKRRRMRRKGVYLRKYYFSEFK